MWIPQLIKQIRSLYAKYTSLFTISFQPKTEMEKEMAAVLNNSKHNLKNDTVYTQAELEIIKAMNLKEVCLPAFVSIIVLGKAKTC